MSQPLPVTILTGFLGSGKTTLLRHILNENHGYKIAVIENEFGEVAIDDAIIGDRATTITTLSNGCICCSSQNELASALFDLLDAIDDQTINFDRLIIECTGMADPGPIIQTFFSDGTLGQRFLLDGIITLVDTVHAEEQLNQFSIAQAQIGYADRILLTKTDLQPDNGPLIKRLQQINIKAPIYTVLHGNINLDLLFDINGFILNDQLTFSTPIFRPVVNQQANHIQSIVIQLNKPVELETISNFMEQLLSEHADQLLRYKGILAINQDNRLLLFQGVQRLYSADWDREWQADEEQKSTLVFIGIDLPEQKIREGFSQLIN